MAITITHKDENDETSPAMFGEHEQLEYATEVSFSELVFESFVGQKPAPEQLKVLNLIFNLCFDHGPSAPSAAATIVATKEGKLMGEAVGVGVAQITDSHGGASEPLMELMYRIKSGELSSKDAVAQVLGQGKRMPGFGHRVYKDKDPRAELILETARNEGIGIEFMKVLEEIHQELHSQSGKSLPLNYDGAIAAALCGMGLEPKLGKALFIVARTPGLIAHFLNNRA